ncbi:MAG: 1,6-anhydro-N-acetylmuramyl-L-alanine amidase AmpD, partial [Gammaproteobacteria bacterium]
MKTHPMTGLLAACQQCPSPNKDHRPENTVIDVVVIHSISLPPGRYGSDDIERFFQNRLDKDAHRYFNEIHEMQVSAQILIKRTGEVVQFVPFNERAWHAGQSMFEGRNVCNDFSIGIERLVERMIRGRKIYCADKVHRFACAKLTIHRGVFPFHA